MKKGLCIGLNYPGTEYELAGCVNDAHDWADLLRKQGFQVDLLLNGDATRTAILGHLRALLAQLKPVDTAVVCYSGHGTWVPDKDGDEPDGRDECLCPADMGDDGRNLIVDDELSELFLKVPAGAKVVFLTDSCHSGTVFRFAGGGRRRIRFIPPSHFLKRADLQQAMVRAYGQSARRSNTPLPGVIHFSGCKDSEYSCDAEFGGRPNGAFTKAALAAFETALRQNGTYMDVGRNLRAVLPSWEYPQTPQLNAPTGLKRTRVFQ
jgi:hypothetical protein